MVRDPRSNMLPVVARERPEWAGESPGGASRHQRRPGGFSAAVQGKPLCAAKPQPMRRAESERKMTELSLTLA